MPYLLFLKNHKKFENCRLLKLVGGALWVVVVVVVLAVVRPTGVYLLDFFCSDIQFYLLFSPYLCFISVFIS